MGGSCGDDENGIKDVVDVCGVRVGVRVFGVWSFSFCIFIVSCDNFFFSWVLFNYMISKFCWVFYFYFVDMGLYLFVFEFFEVFGLV